MGKEIEQSGYRELVLETVALYENTRKAITLFYWQTGQRIVEVEQKGEGKAVHGSALLEKLSADLIKLCGQDAGFSVRNLRRMRSFYLAHPNRPTSADLNWSQRVELLSVKDDRVRARLEQQVARESMGSREVRRLVREAQSDRRSVEVSARKFPPLKRPADLRPNTYQEVTGPAAAFYKAGKEHVLLDCGFFVCMAVTRTQAARVTVTDKPSYTYAATVERVVDGDTLLVVITLGFNISVREKLRLKGINTPELGTPDGEKAKKYVTAVLPVGSPLLIKSHKTDIYGRFVADVFFNPDAATAKAIFGNGIYLNQKLLDEGQAVRVS